MLKDYGFFHDYPYTNFHEMNLDWLLSQMLELRSDMKNFVNQNTIKYADPIRWNITSQYEGNTVVCDSSGNAYLSVQPVPAGVNINNMDYWTQIGNFSELFSSVKESIAAADEGTSSYASANRTVNELVWLSDILYIITADMVTGESYIEGTNCEKVTIENLLKNQKSDYTNNINELRLITDNFVTPEEYGAVGDGVTDDSESIAEASTHGTLYGNSEKHYRIKKEITITGNTVGMNFVFDDTKAVRYNSNTYHINDTYETPLSEVQAHSGRGDAVVLIIQKENINMINCRFTRGTNFVAVHNSNNIIFDDCLFWRAYQTGFDAGGNGYALLIDNENKNIKITNCTFKSIGRHAIYLSQDGGDDNYLVNRHILIDNNIFDWTNVNNEELPVQGENTDVMINIRYSCDVTISNNKFIGVIGAVTLIENINDVLDDIQILDNYIELKSGSTVHAVRISSELNHTSHNILIDGNIIKARICMLTVNGKISNNTLISSYEAINIGSGYTDQECIIENNYISAPRAAIGSTSSNNHIKGLYVKNNHIKCNNTGGVLSSGAVVTNVLFDGNTFEVATGITNSPLTCTKATYIGNYSPTQSSLTRLTTATTTDHTLDKLFTF